MVTPIISANMDTVTEASMAIAMAQAGSIGKIYRFMPIAKKIVEVTKVKRAESFIVEIPAVITPEASLGEARNRMATEEIGGLVVVDEGQHLLGI